MPRLALFLWVLTAVSAWGSAPSNCDVLNLGATTVADVQQVIGEGLGTKQALHDLNQDGVVNVVDVQIDINAAVGLACAADPGLVSVVPNSGQQGATSLVVTITGRLTNFTNSSSVNLGDGITVSNIAATSATSLTATLAIPSAAPIGGQTLTVDSFTLANAFTVTLPVSVSYSYDSQGRVATATYVLASGGTTTVTYTYDAAGNRTAVVAR